MLYEETIGEGALPRLVERKQLEFAVAYLMGRGVEPEEIALTLPRRYHVDMDALNAVLADRYLLDYPEELAKAA